MQQKDTELQQKDTELQQKDTELQQKDTELQQKDTELQQKDTELQKKDTELQQKDTDICQMARDMIFEALIEKGDLSEVVIKRIKAERDVNILKAMHTAAITSKSIYEFEEKVINL